MASVGVSYVAIFILSYHIVMWIGGAASTLAWDYAPGVPQGEAANVRVGWREKPVGGYIHRTFFQKNSEEAGRLNDAEKVGVPDALEIPEELVSDPDIQLVRRMSRVSISSSHKGGRRPSVSRPVTKLEPPINTNAHPSFESLHDEKPEPMAQPAVVETSPEPLTPFAKFWAVAGTLFNPITVTIYISLPIALVPALKSLFVLPASRSDPYYFVAPDGNPPLHFILNTTSFVGALCVPMSLILLGASFARLKIPRPFLQKAPVWAIWWVCVAKLVFLPVIGIFFVQGLASKGVVHKEEIALRFVAMLLSGTPSAVK